VIGSVVVEADGGSRGNPGPAGYGAVVKDASTGEVLAEVSDAIGVATNNVAEYRGLIAGLQAAQDLGAQRVAIRMDSKLVVEQMKGTWKIKNEALRELARQAAQLRLTFPEVSFEWVARERNKHADRLANEAMDRAAGKPTRPAVSAAPSWAPPSGPATRLLLVRHGATLHSAEHRFSGRNELSLAPDGEAQAAALAGRAYPDVAAVITSPLPRARQTAQVIADKLDLPLAVDEQWTELDFGAFEGLTPGEVRQQYPDDYAAWSASPDVAPPGGESFSGLARRVRRAWDAVLAAHPDRTVLVVTHVTPIKTLVRVALDAPFLSLFRMYLDTASVTELDYFADGTPSLRLFNDTAHLRR
jgi:ribonuclease H / adenosylcobalamin/alpha-ribazole phosphatase